MISRLGKASIMAASMPPKEAMPRTDLRISSVTSDGSARSTRDRKSTRLNSSHSQISYAVFCLKKKKNNDSKATEAILRRENIQTTTNFESDRTLTITLCTALLYSSFDLRSYAVLLYYVRADAS